MGASFRYSAEGWDGVCGIIGDGETVRLSRAGLRGPGSPVIESRPSLDEWERFWSLAESLGAWSWQGDYGHGFDGTPWTLEMERDGKVMSCSGNGTWGVLAPPGFDQLYRAMRGLCEKKGSSRAGGRAGSSRPGVHSGGDRPTSRSSGPGRRSKP